MASSDILKMKRNEKERKRKSELIALYKSISELISPGSSQLQEIKRAKLIYNFVRQQVQSNGFLVDAPGRKEHVNLKRLNTHPKTQKVQMYRSLHVSVDLASLSWMDYHSYISSRFQYYMTWHSLEGLIIHADASITSVAGYTCQEVTKKFAHDFIDQSCLSIVKQAHDRMVNSKGHGIVSYALIGKYGMVYLKSRGEFVNTASGQQILMLMNHVITREDFEIEKSINEWCFSTSPYTSSPISPNSFAFEPEVPYPSDELMDHSQDNGTGQICEAPANWIGESDGIVNQSPDGNDSGYSDSDFTLNSPEIQIENSPSRIDDNLASIIDLACQDLNLESIDSSFLEEFNSS